MRGTRPRAGRCGLIPPALALLVCAAATLAPRAWSQAQPAGASAPQDPPDLRQSAPVDSVGRIRGRIADSRTGRPLANANVVLSGTRLGTISQDDGTFLLDGLAPGSYTVVVTYIGFEEARATVDLDAGSPPALTFNLIPTVAAVLDPVVVQAERPVVDVQRTSTEHTLLAQELETLIAKSPSLDEVVAQQPGVTREQGRLHFRGGRADENLFLIDGIGVRDVLSGDSDGRELSAKSASQVSVVTGGMSARYGQAMSGVIDARIKEGSRRWQGSLAYDSDILLDARNIHQLHLELEGPNVPLAALLRLLGSERPNATFYGGAGFEFSDAFNAYVQERPNGPTLRSSVTDEVFGRRFRYGDFFYPTASNNWRGVLKTTWRATAHDKFTLNWTKNLGFRHDWGEADIGDIDRNTDRFPWSYARHLEGHYTISRDFNLLSLGWNRTLGLNTQTSVQLWRQYTGQHQDVFGKHYSLYDDLRDSDLLEDPSFVDTPYFVDVGDAGDWRDRFAVVWGVRNDWTYRWRTHAFEAGWSAEYHDVQYMQLNALAVYIDPANPNNSLPLGDEFDLFHVTPNVGDAYVQDHFEHQGLVVDLGLHYDYWFPGAQVERALERGQLPHMTPELRQKFLRESREVFGHRVKGHLSPRVGISFPISERSHLFFNYNHNSQRPPYYYVYAKSSSQSGEEYPRIGNPTLNPKISVSYEIGSEYEFTPATAVRATLFWKDMYDYPTSIRLVMQERRTSRSNFFMYWNMDYARSRGIELVLDRRRKGFLAGNLSYTYSVGKGKASDPNKTKLIQETGGDSRETALGEEFLWWNRPHKLTARLTLQIRANEDPPRWLGLRWPRDFSIGLAYMIRSGRPYTPQDQAGNDIGAPYSRNGPYDSSCDLSVAKGFHLGRRRFEVSFDVYNLFDYRTPNYFDPVTGRPYEPGRGSLIYGYDNPDNYDDYILAALARQHDPELLDQIREDYQATHGQEPTNDELIEVYRELTPNASEIEQSIGYQFQAAAHSLGNPAYYGPPRSYRLGITYEW